ncbi:MAG: PleD family two-component system response regulator [Gammaproteobacteria bacterium]
MFWDSNLNSNKNIRVLVVDDSTAIQTITRSLLVKEGFEVCTASNGYEALAKVVDFQPRVILLDDSMPRLDGYETCAVIKNHDRYNRIFVVMLLSQDGLIDRARGHMAGVDHFLTKPFTREELLGVIRPFQPDSNDEFEEKSGSKEVLIKN